MQRRLALGLILIAILLAVAWFWLREEPERGVSPPWQASRYVVLLAAEVSEELEQLPERPTSLRGADPRFPGIDAGIARQVDLAKRRLAVVRALAPGRYRLYDLQRGLTFTPESIEVRAGERASIDVGWRLR